VPRSQAHRLVEALNRPQNAQYAAAFDERSYDRNSDKYQEKAKDARGNLAATKPGDFGFGGGGGLAGGSGLAGGGAGRPNSSTQPADNAASKKTEEPNARNSSPAGGGSGMQATPGSARAAAKPATTTPVALAAADPMGRVDAPIARGETLQLVDARMRIRGEPVVLKLKVSEQGTIVVAGLGDVPVAGLTLREANERLAAGMKDKAPESAGAQLRRAAEQETLADAEDAVDVVIVLHRTPDPSAPATRPTTEPVAPTTLPARE